MSDRVREEWEREAEIDRRGERRGPPHAGAEDEDDQPAVPQAEEDEGADTRGPAAHSWGLDESEDLGPEVGDFHPLKQISSEADMGGALALLRLWRHQANVIRERMEEAIRRAEEWAAPKVARLENSAEHLERRILAYAEDHPEVFHGKKTARWPGGAVKKTEREEGYWRLEKTPDARARLVASVKAHMEKVGPLAPPLVRKEEIEVLQMEAIKHYASKDHLRLDGLEWVPPGTTLKVTTGEE